MSRPLTTGKMVLDVNKETKVHSFKSSEHIHKNVDGLYFDISAKKASSVTL